MPDWINVFFDWLALPSLALLAGLLIYRKQHKEFPLFFLYVISTELVGLTRLAASRAPALVYSYVYWISNIVVVLFALLASYELFIKRLFPSFYKVRFFRYLFPLVAILFNVVAVLVAVYGNHKRLLLLTARTSEFLRATILFFFVALMTAMGRQWGKKEFGIAFGFGLDVSTSLAAVALVSQSPARTDLLNRFSVIAYDIACIIWLYCFWTAKETTAAPPPVSPQALEEARKWESSLKGFVAPGKR
jgi:hypothetical protein